jgi:hypothetical protein
MGKSEETWFPPRPQIKKDPEAIKRLYSKVEVVEPRRSVIRRLNLVTHEDE